MAPQIPVGMRREREGERDEKKKKFGGKLQLIESSRVDGGMKHKCELNRDVGYLQTECRKLESWRAFLGITAAVSASLRFQNGRSCLCIISQEGGAQQLNAGREK